jgi:hypothetical protein
MMNSEEFGGKGSLPNFKALSQYSSGRNDENHEKLESE